MGETAVEMMEGMEEAVERQGCVARKTVGWHQRTSRGYPGRGSGQIADPSALQRLLVVLPIR